MYHTQYSHFDAEVAKAQVATGVYRSKVAQRPDVIPAAPVTLRALFRLQAAKKCLRAIARHGEKSFQAIKAHRSRWLPISNHEQFAALRQGAQAS